MVLLAPQRDREVIVQLVLSNETKAAVILESMRSLSPFLPNIASKPQLHDDERRLVLIEDKRVEEKLGTLAQLLP
jgi:hypothetical protein